MMFKIIKETTVWSAEYMVYNHTYLLDPKNRIIAYLSEKDGTIHKLNSPYVIDKKYRKFVEVKNAKLSKLIPKDYKEERQENTMPSAFVRVFKVKSKSKNKTYEVSFQINTKQLSCGCTGYGYRRTCSHVKAVANKLGV